MATRAASLSADELRPSFEEEWPELARRLEHLLASKRVERCLRADAIQETAARLYPRWETLDHSRPLWNLAATIAVRVVHDHRRKESRIELVADPVLIHRGDVDMRGVQRAQLDKTRRALRYLNTDQRRVLLAEVGEAVLPDGTRNRINVLRLRARAKLRERLGPWAPSGVAIKLSYLRARIVEKRSTMDVYLPATANSLVTAVTAATLALGGTAVGTENAIAIDAATSVPREQTRVLSLTDLGEPNPDVTASIQRRTPGLSRPKARADSTYDADPGWADNTMDEVNNQGKTIDDQGRTIDDQGRTIDDQGRTIDDQGKTIDDQGKTIDDQEQTVQNLEEEYKTQEEKVEDQLP